MLTFLHAADIHLDSPLRNLDRYEGAPADAVRGAGRRALENLVDLALARSADFVLISGDLYDGEWKDYNTGLHFVSRMSRLRDADIPVFIISGNHDASSRMTRVLRLPDNVHMLSTGSPESICVEKSNAVIHGQGFSSPGVKKNMVTDYPDARPGYFNIGMLHTCATGREGHEPYAPCTVSDMTDKGYDYWALGHVHKREILSEEPYIVFSGNIQGRHIRESGSKGCMLVEVDGNGRAKPEFHPLDVLRWEMLRPDISHAEDGYGAVDRICEQMQTVLDANEGLPLALRVEISGPAPAHDMLSGRPEHWKQQIRGAVLDRAGDQVWLEKIIFRTRPPEDDLLSLSPDGPVGELLGVFDDIPSDPEMMKILSGSLDDLARKLPRELKDISESLRFEDQKWLEEMIAGVRPILLSRLLRTP
ncbi:MAG: exonuclease SbcCD subunit D [Desulfococcaceae bacterium]